MDKHAETIRKWLGTGSINIFGPPFSGKDTQGKKLANLLGATLIGGGEILRSDITPQHIQKHLKTGELTPTEDYRSIVLPYLEKSKFDNKPLILSAVGRWKGEEIDVINAAKEAGHPLKVVIFLELSEQAIWKRWYALKDKQDRGNRSDDTEDSLKVRLKEYQTKTLPVIEHYQKSSLLIKVDGSRSVEEIFTDIINKLGHFISSRR